MKKSLKRGGIVNLFRKQQRKRKSKTLKVKPKKGIQKYEVNLANLPLIIPNENGDFVLGKKYLHKEGNIYTLYLKSGLFENDIEVSEFDTVTNETTFEYCRFFADFTMDNKLKKSRICYLGLGLGTQGMEMSKYPDVDRIDYVDLDSDSFRFLHTGFPVISPKIHFYETDAESFLKSSRDSLQEGYDIVMDDVFTDTKVFLDYELVASCIVKGGYLFINLHYLRDYYKIEDMLRRLFKHVAYYEKNSICVVCQK